MSLFENKQGAGKMKVPADSVFSSLKQLSFASPSLWKFQSVVHVFFLGNQVESVLKFYLK